MSIAKILASIEQVNTPLLTQEKFLNSQQREHAQPFRLPFLLGLFFQKRVYFLFEVLFGKSPNEHLLPL